MLVYSIVGKGILMYPKTFDKTFNILFFDLILIKLGELYYDNENFVKCEENFVKGMQFKRLNSKHFSILCCLNRYKMFLPICENQQKSYTLQNGLFSLAEQITKKQRFA